MEFLNSVFQHLNLPNMPIVPQLRDIRSLKPIKIFQFCKKILIPHFQEINKEQKQRNLKFWPRPPLLLKAEKPKMAKMGKMHHKMLVIFLRNPNFKSSHIDEGFIFLNSVKSSLFHMTQITIFTIVLDSYLLQFTLWKRKSQKITQFLKLKNFWRLQKFHKNVFPAMEK